MMIVRRIIESGKESAEQHAHGLRPDTDFESTVARKVASVLDVDADGGVLVARSEDDIVGFVTYFVDGWHGSIGDVWVEPELRGGRLAVKLTRQAEDCMVSSGASFITATAMAGARVAVSTLEHMGYLPVAMSFVRKIGED